MSELAERSEEIINEADRERKLNRIRDLQKFDKANFKKLMEEVDDFPKLVTIEQKSRAKDLILDGIATDAQEAYQIMVSEGNKTNDAYTR